MKQFVLCWASIVLLIGGCQTSDVASNAREIAGYRPAMDLRGVDPGLTVQPTEVMVLGTAHLNAIDGLNSGHLDPLINRLAEYAPDVITTEDMRGEVCETLWAYPDEYPEIAENWCFDVTGFRTESGLSAAEGAASVRNLIVEWPKVPSSAQRRRLAASFLAAGEPYSALVQWLRIPETDRTPGFGLGPDSKAFLNERAASMNESSSIAARLAARLGLERVYGIEDFTSAVVLHGQGSDLWERMEQIWPPADAPFREALRIANDNLTSGSPLAAYRSYNAPETQRATTANDFQLAMNDPNPEQYGRFYNSWHQVRNLRMVSAVMAAASTKPGGRVLVVVGLAHKPYFEALLDQMHDIKLVSTDEVLLP